MDTWFPRKKVPTPEFATPTLNLGGEQKQNGDLVPQHGSIVPGLAYPESVSAGNLSMDPIADFASRAVVVHPIKNLKQR